MINFKNAEDIIRVQPMMQPTSKIVYITAKPIKIAPLETLKVTIETLSVRPYIDQDLILYLEGYYQKKPKSCQCEMAILFRNGCQCGGI